MHPALLLSPILRYITSSNVPRACGVGLNIPRESRGVEAANKFAQALLEGKALYASLHTADPGDTGAHEVAGAGYRRRLIDGSEIRFDDMPAVTVTHMGIWETMYGGGFCRSAAIAAGKTTLKGDTFCAQMTLIDEARPSTSKRTGDMFHDIDSGLLSVWNGIAWDEVGAFKNFEQRTVPMWGLEDYHTRPCPYCGTLNPPDATECGGGCWNGCGAPLREQ